MDVTKDEKPDADQRLPVFTVESDSSTARSRSSRKGRALASILTILIVTTCLLTGSAPWPHQGPWWRSGTNSGSSGKTASCEQVSPLQPKNQSRGLNDMDEYITSDAYQDASIKRLSGAVQIPTESFDDLGAIGEDKRWEIMYDFAAYLKKTFPGVHNTLSLEMVNTHGLLFTWKGQDEALKPTLLMAHQDVVPVPASTVDAWTHPPFSGFYDGKYIWGRGASDCKNQLIGILEAVEELVKANFTPRRTILLSFGFDEEISGANGAGHLAPFILHRYGPEGIAAIVDEGATFAKNWGMRTALPGVGEKGYTDVHITIRMPGGHSSVPPDHTGIGVMSELITLIEAHQYPTHLDDQNPYLGLLTCGAEHAPDFPSKLKHLLHRRQKGTSASISQCTKKLKQDHLALEAAKAGPATKYLMQTSIAADVISGGVKVNALPERTTAIINHRINIGEHSSGVHDKITKLAESIAHKYNLTLHAFDDAKETPQSIMLYAGHTLEPAPVTPTDVSELSPYAVLAGTIRALYGEDIVVAPGIMTGNTDTRYYWDVSKHIFRFTAGWDGESFGFGNIHTVDEKISVKSHVNMVRWMSLFIRIMDGSELE
ncbi:hypothetical protein PMZ80_008840 [Knufia obscura]|uniref:Peptidase M20 dimerisation domain-containing protein n=1 Tax=Knufia obscura TaxID=1635080 RepID=A0ABR0REW1_9EURO|nr:hypothetical protein PMZ80_008840 [Knufia obscura]